MHYRAQVSNGAGAPLDRVFVVAFLPPEVTFVSADLLPEVEATLYNRIGAEESITWNVGEIGPGDEVTLTWAVRVVSPGDMTAVNAVRAVADGAPRVRRESATYLATATNVGGPNPSPSPSTTRVVSYERVPAGSAQGATAGEPGVVPETGFSGELVVSAAALLVGAGALLWWIGAPGPRRRRRVALAAAAMALLAACTSSGDLDHATPRQTGSPQVKGRRIGPDGQTRDLGEDRGGPSENGDRTSGRGGRDDGSADEPVGGGDVPTPTEPAPAPGGFTFVRTVDVLPVDPFLEPVAKLASRDADETVTYTWSGAGIAGIQSSTSAYGSPVEVGTVLRERGPALEATVRVTNASADTPVLVDGTLGLRIDGSAEAVLTAAPARSTLMPGGSTSASFTFDLPAGSYSSTGFFAAS